MAKTASPLLVVISLLACACGTSGQISGGAPQGEAIRANSGVIVIALGDAMDKSGATLGRSGNAITAAVRAVLVAHSYSAAVSNSKTLPEGFTEAEKLGYSYVLKGALVNWKWTDWSAHPDPVGLTLEVYDVASKSLVASATRNMRTSTISYTPGSDPLAAALADLVLSQIFRWRPEQSSLTPK